MRNTFAETLYREATEDDRIFIVVADISPVGNMANFRTEYPDRFVNVGVAEQSMIGICAGLALKGCQPFAYTIATFSLYRPFEMVRDDLCYQNLPVTVVGIGGGVTYSTLGGTHHAQEDVAVMSAIPNMAVIAPCAVTSSRVRPGNHAVPEPGDDTFSGSRSVPTAYQVPARSVPVRLCTGTTTARSELDVLLMAGATTASPLCDIRITVGELLASRKV